MQPASRNHLLPLLQAAFLVMVICALMLPLAVCAQKFTTGPAGSWVAPLTFQQPAKSDAASTGDYHELLLDRQVNAVENELFVHVVRQVRTYSGIEHGSVISADFDPDYESLKFHWIKIWRGTNSLNRLDPDKIKLVQNEPELNDLMIFGQQTAVAVLEDVRVGDIIDFAYTIGGANPVYAGRFCDRVPVQLREPIDRLRTRLLWPIQRRVYFTNHLCSVRPVIVNRSNVVELTWDFKQVPALPVEDSLPTWFRPDPFVQLTEFATWGAVNQWALRLFQNPGTISTDLKQKIDQWKTIGRWDDRVLAVLKFVQNDIRYFGIEIGVNGNQPSPPSQVFERRFGDCKDKAFLFVTILRQMGIEAYPVLVNSRARRSLDDWMPSAHAFDHVIAFVRFEGRSYWLDCTAHQNGTFANYRPPDFERGLVIRADTTRLSVIPSGSGSQTTISEYFQLRDWTKPADLKVVTVAEGLDAEALRREFAATSRDDILKQYLHFYSRSYPGIKSADKIQYQDDEQRNRVEVTEFYTIDNAWEKAEQRNRYTASFYPVMFSRLMAQPVDKDRHMPLGVPFPRHLIQHTEVILPDFWPGNREDKVISDPAFSFERHIWCNGRRLEMDYEFESLSDFVPPESVAQYLEKLTAASQSMGYSVGFVF